MHVMYIHTYLQELTTAFLTVTQAQYTVRFVVRQTNSTEEKLCIVDDNTFEDSEFFQLRILAFQFPPNLRGLLILIPGFDSVTAPIEIEDNDSELYI